MAWRIMALCGSMADNFGSDMRVHAHQKKFVIGERAGFVENAIGDENLANIVNARGIDQIGSFFRRTRRKARAMTSV